MNQISMNHFNTNLLAVAGKTAVVLVATHLLGRLGYYSVSMQTTALISTIAFLVAALAHKFFDKGSKLSLFYYGATPVGMGVGIALHRFMYPATALSSILDLKGAIILNLMLGVIEFIYDSAYHYINDSKDKKSLVALHHFPTKSYSDPLHLHSSFKEVFY